MEEYGIDRERYFDVIGKMARDAMNSGSPQNTIKDISEEDIIEIYKRAWMKEQARIYFPNGMEDNGMGDEKSMGNYRKKFVEGSESL